MRFVDILSDNHSDFIKQYQSRLTSSMYQAMNAMLRCKTQTQGVSQWDCNQWQQHIECPLSCGHRSCNLCQHNTTQDWLNRQQMKLLPVDYYMDTFTLPSQLRALTFQHQ
nr:transposase zinc-binding domain-containing protein [Parashewanella spongiae]